MGYSDSGPSPRTARRIANELAELLARSRIAGPVVLVGESIAGFNVRMFASDHPEHAAGLVLVDASHEGDAHEVPGMARFVPLLSTIGVFRLLGVSFGQPIESLAPSVRPFARATMFRASGHQAAADEIIHIRETVSEVRSSGRRLTIPVLVVTGARGADENWRRLQQDQASLSERGCLITAQKSGHVVAIDQPEIIVDAIRTVVETARGHDVPLCGTPLQAVTITHLGDEAALIGLTGAPPVRSTSSVAVLGSGGAEFSHGSNSRKFGSPHLSIRARRSCLKVVSNAGRLRRVFGKGARLMAEQTVKLDPTHHDFGTLTKLAERLQELVNLKQTRDGSVALLTPS